MSAIRRLLDRLYSAPNSGYRIPLLGLDASGKTTLLYRLKTGEIVTTIPTIGVNIETISVDAGKEKLTMTAWDAGGCTKPGLIRLYAPYMADSDALIWVVDSFDRDRITESREELVRHISFILQFSSKSRMKDTLPVLIICTKQDHPQRMSVDELKTKFAPSVKDSPVFFSGSSLKDRVPDDGFAWLLTQIKAIGAGHLASSQQPSTPTIPDPRSASALETKLDEWLRYAETDSPPAEFLEQFESLSLPKWDHYTHVRLAYVILTTHERQKGKDMIFDGIERYIAQSTQTRGRTFHVTMTYFWIQMVHFGIRSMPPAPQPDASSSETLVVENLEKKLHGFGPDPSDFPRFLLLNPFVVDGNLWADYYSKDVIMSPDAKAGMVLPDKKHLPNIVARETIPTQGKGT